MKELFPPKGSDLFLPGFINQITSNDSIFSVLSVGMIVFDRNGVIQQINTRAQEDLKWTNKQIRNQHLFNLLGLFYNKQNIFPEIISRLSKGEELIELTTNVYIQLLENEHKFYIKGQFLGQYTNEQLSRIVFLFRIYEDEYFVSDSINV